MSAVLQLQAFAASCSKGGFEDICFQACQQYLVFSQTDNQASFGPRYSSLVVDNKQSCSCTIYNVVQANIASTNTHSGDIVQAIGQSPNGDPFNQVIASRPIGSNVVTVTWTASGDSPDFTTGSTCSGTYYPVSGPSVLPNNAYYYSYWWAVLVGCLAAAILVCTFCGYCYCYPRRRVAKNNISSHPPLESELTPRSATPFASNSFASNGANGGDEQFGDVPPYKWNYHRSSMTVRPSENQPPVPAARVSSNNNIPIAVAIPVDEHGRQLAIV